MSEGLLCNAVRCGCTSYIVGMYVRTKHNIFVIRRSSVRCRHLQIFRSKYFDSADDIHQLV